MGEFKLRGKVLCDSFVYLFHLSSHLKPLALHVLGFSEHAHLSLEVKEVLEACLQSKLVFHVDSCDVKAHFAVHLLLKAADVCLAGLVVRPEDIEQLLHFLFELGEVFVPSEFSLELLVQGSSQGFSHILG